MIRSVTRAWMALVLVTIAACSGPGNSPTEVAKTPALAPDGPPTVDSGPVGGAAKPGAAREDRAQVPLKPSPVPKADVRGWGKVARETFYWSGPYDDAIPFDKAPAEYAVQVIYTLGYRVYVQDPQRKAPKNVAWIDRDALRLDPETELALRPPPVHETIAMCVPAATQSPEKYFAPVRDAFTRKIDELNRPAAQGATIQVMVGWGPERTLSMIDVPAWPSAISSLASTPTPYTADLPVIVQNALSAQATATVLAIEAKKGQPAVEFGNSINEAKKKLLVSSCGWDASRANFAPV